MHTNGKVDFLVVGTQKGGTTALASFLSQHPSVFIPGIKEAHFFDVTRNYYDPEAGLVRYGDYHRLFAPAKANQLWGEATPIYMFLRFVPKRIYQYNPAIKIIFLLRDPVKRAFSHFSMQRSRNLESHSFTVAVALEFVRLYLLSRSPGDLRDPFRVHSYVSRGFYSGQIARFFDLFPRENCLFLKSEELLAHHSRVMRNIFVFLGVDPGVEVPFRRVYVGNGGQPNQLLARGLRLLYRPELRRLERLTGLSFPEWV
jgi:Sulfotransferase domain